MMTLVDIGRHMNFCHCWRARRRHNCARRDSSSYAEAADDGRSTRASAQKQATTRFVVSPPRRFAPFFHSPHRRRCSHARARARSSLAYARVFNTADARAAKRRARLILCAAAARVKPRDFARARATFQRHKAATVASSTVASSCWRSLARAAARLWPWRIFSVHTAWRPRWSPPSLPPSVER